MKTLRFLSLFGGAGGLDLGFELSGWQCAYTSDHDVTCIETLRSNVGRKVGDVRALSGCYVEQADVSDLRGREVLAKAGLRRGDLVALVGGPPCQSWSSAGHQLGFEDPRGQLFRDYVRLAAELDVRWLVFENVRGLLTARGPDGEPGSALQQIRAALLDAGFHTEVNLLNAADYGVPQRRVRLLMIGFKKGDRPPFPIPTHTKAVDLFHAELKPWVTLREGISTVVDLSDREIIRPSPRLAELLAHVPEGYGLRSPGKREATRPGGHWGYKQGCFVADMNLPSRTVTASSQQDWIRDPERGMRRLSPRECAALQSFPTSWNFSGGRGAQYRQIGNAVPVLLARALGSALAQHVRSSLAYRERSISKKGLLPLNAALASAIEYTRKEETRNGASRRAAPSKRRAAARNWRDR